MKLVLSLVALWISSAGVAQAIPVVFTTSGQLSCGANASCTPVSANQLVFASTLVGGPALTITYNTGGDASDVPPTASANFGSISAACAGCTTANAAAWSMAGASAIVTFLQSAPFAGSNTLGASFSSTGFGWNGAAPGQTGLALFTWGADGTTIVGPGEPVAYTIFTSAVLLQLGNNSIQGLVGPVPEPSSLALLVLGLVGLRRLRRS